MILNQSIYLSNLLIFVFTASAENGQLIENSETISSTDPTLTELELTTSQLMQNVMSTRLKLNCDNLPAFFIPETYKDLEELLNITVDSTEVIHNTEEYHHRMKRCSELDRQNRILQEFASRKQKESVGVHKSDKLHPTKKQNKNKELPVKDQVTEQHTDVALEDVASSVHNLLSKIAPNKSNNGDTVTEKNVNIAPEELRGDMVNLAPDLPSTIVQTALITEPPHWSTLKIEDITPESAQQWFSSNPHKFEVSTINSALKRESKIPNFPSTFGEKSTTTTFKSKDKFPSILKRIRDIMEGGSRKDMEETTSRTSTKASFANTQHHHSESDAIQSKIKELKHLQELLLELVKSNSYFENATQIETKLKTVPLKVEPQISKQSINSSIKKTNSRSSSISKFDKDLAKLPNSNKNNSKSSTTTKIMPEIHQPDKSQLYEYQKPKIIPTTPSSSHSSVIPEIKISAMSSSENEKQYKNSISKYTTPTLDFHMSDVPHELKFNQPSEKEYSTITQNGESASSSHEGISSVPHKLNLHHPFEEKFSVTPHNIAKSDKSSPERNFSITLETENTSNNFSMNGEHSSTLSTNQTPKSDLAPNKSNFLETRTFKVENTEPQSKAKHRFIEKSNIQTEPPYHQTLLSTLSTTSMKNSKKGQSNEGIISDLSTLTPFHHNQSASTIAHIRTEGIPRQAYTSFPTASSIKDEISIPKNTHTAFTYESSPSRKSESNENMLSKNVRMMKKTKKAHEILPNDEVTTQESFKSTVDLHTTPQKTQKQLLHHHTISQKTHEQPINKEETIEKLNDLSYLHHTTPQTLHDKLVDHLIYQEDVPERSYEQPHIYHVTPQTLHEKLIDRLIHPKEISEKIRNLQSNENLQKLQDDAPQHSISQKQHEILPHQHITSQKPFENDFHHHQIPTKSPELMYSGKDPFEVTTIPQITCTAQNMASSTPSQTTNSQSNSDIISIMEKLTKLEKEKRDELITLHKKYLETLIKEKTHNPIHETELPTKDGDGTDQATERTTSASKAASPSYKPDYRHKFSLHGHTTEKHNSSANTRIRKISHLHHTSTSQPLKSISTSINPLYAQKNEQENSFMLEKPHLPMPPLNPNENWKFIKKLDDFYEKQKMQNTTLTPKRPRPSTTIWTSTPATPTETPRIKTATERSTTPIYRSSTTIKPTVTTTTEKSKQRAYSVNSTITRNYNITINLAPDPESVRSSKENEEGMELVDESISPYVSDMVDSARTSISPDLFTVSSHSPHIEHIISPYSDPSMVSSARTISNYNQFTGTYSPYVTPSILLHSSDPIVVPNNDSDQFTRQSAFPNEEHKTSTPLSSSKLVSSIRTSNPEQITESPSLYDEPKKPAYSRNPSTVISGIQATTNPLKFTPSPYSYPSLANVKTTLSPYSMPIDFRTEVPYQYNGLPYHPYPYAIDGRVQSPLFYQPPYSPYSPPLDIIPQSPIQQANQYNGAFPVPPAPHGNEFLSQRSFIFENQDAIMESPKLSVPKLPEINNTPPQQKHIRNHDKKTLKAHAYPNFDYLDDPSKKPTPSFKNEKLETAPTQFPCVGENCTKKECNNIYVVPDRSGIIVELLRLLNVDKIKQNSTEIKESPILQSSNPRMSPNSEPEIPESAVTHSKTLTDMKTMLGSIRESINSGTDTVQLRQSINELLTLLKQRRNIEYKNLYASRLNPTVGYGKDSIVTIVQINEYVELLELMLVYLARDPDKLLDEENDARITNDESPYPRDDPHRRLIEDQFYYVHPKILNEFIDIYKKYSRNNGYFGKPAWQASQENGSRRSREEGIGKSLNRLFNLQGLLPGQMYDRSSMYKPGYVD